MQCPVCKTVHLTMADRNGIEIDYCPQCRGVWLDRGELDKIIERVGVAEAPPPRPAAPPPQPTAWAQPAAAKGTGAARTPLILVLGDSLSAEYGITPVSISSTVQPTDQMSAAKV